MNESSIEDEQMGLWEEHISGYLELTKFPFKWTSMVRILNNKPWDWTPEKRKKKKKQRMQTSNIKYDYGITL
jgi:hypothetical protein